LRHSPQGDLCRTSSGNFIPIVIRIGRTTVFSTGCKDKAVKPSGKEIKKKKGRFMKNLPFEIVLYSLNLNL